MFYTNMVSDFTRLRYNVDSGISDSDSETGGISMKRIVRGRVRSAFGGYAAFDNGDGGGLHAGCDK